MTEIRTDVAIDVHPDALLPRKEALDIPGTPGQRAYGVARGVLATIYEGLGKFNDVEKAMTKETGRAVMKHGVGKTAQKTMGARGHDYANACKQAFNRTAREVDIASRAIAKQRDALDASIAKAMRDPDANTPAGAGVAQQVRDHLRSMGKGKQLTFVHNAAKAGDRRTLAAVFGAPAYLSGLDEENLAMLRRQAAVEIAPQEQNQLEALGKLADHLDYARNHYIERYAETQKVEQGETKIDKMLGELSNG